MTEKVALITGGGRGMGAAIARTMAARGYKVALMSPSASCEALAAELGGVASRGRAENAADIKAVFDLAMATWGRIDAVVNHTGHPPKADLLDITDEMWTLGNEMIVLSVVRMARLVTPVMQKQGGGAVLNITTAWAYEPSLTFPVSSTYRAGIGAFTRLYADRYGPDGIRMNCLMPGLIDSLSHDPARAGGVPLRRIGKADEVARTAAFLLSDDAGYITGQSIRIDGGATRHV